MKIAVLKGSPHKNGSSNMLANEFIRGAEEAGHHIIPLDIAHMNIKPCMGCEYCGMNGDCAIKDDMPTVRDALLNADMAVFVTPIYYFGMSAQLKAVIDRFYSYTMKLSSKHLKTVLISAAWDSDKQTMDYLEYHYKGICDYMHFQNCGIISGTGCGTPHMTEKTIHMKKAYELGRSIK